MVWTKIAQLRKEKKWTLAEASERIGVSINTLSRWEHGDQSPHGYNLQRLCDTYGVEPLALRAYEPPGQSPHADDLLAIYGQGIDACYDLYFDGNPYQVSAILPLYAHQTAQLAEQPSSLQQRAARLASLAQRLTCELATDREDFGTAQHSGQQAMLYGQLAGDANLQVAALISMVNLGFHRKLSVAALHSCKHAVSLLDESVTPLLKGRLYAGMAEIYAMRQDLQGSMRAMGQAYECYPMVPENDPAYQYLRASRYALYVFGDVQSRLFLGQSKEADRALDVMQKETSDAQEEPITHLDALYYQADIALQQDALEPSTALLAEGAALAKQLGSRLYFNKLAMSYHQLQTRWPHESTVITLEDAFAPW